MTESFGARFQRLRKNKGLTQEDIAKEFNITPQSVSKWENDLSAPDITILVDLAKLLDVSVDVLLGKEEFNPTKICLESERKNIENMILKFVINSSDGDKVKLNIPVVVLKVLSKEKFINLNNDKVNILSKIDFDQIFTMIENGVIGKLVEIESADGDNVVVSVE